jgi:flagellin-like protein
VKADYDMPMGIIGKNGDDKMKRDSAVSPVIGSILLVAITVIIAAVIAAFVFGMVGDVQNTRVVAVTSDVAQNSPSGGKDIIITNHGGKDVGMLSALDVYVDDNVCTRLGTNVGIDVGDTLRLNRDTCGFYLPSIRSHIVVTGRFTDGSRQVILDTYQ